MAISQLYPNQRPTLNLNFARSKTLDSRITFSRGGCAGTYVGSNGLIKTAAVDEPRFDHDPVTGDCRGLLIEELRENFNNQSENFSVYNEHPSAGLTVRTANAGIAPDGTNTAFKIYPSGSQPGVNDRCWIFRNLGNLNIASGTNSVFAKADGKRYMHVFTVYGGYGAQFDLQDGVVTSTHDASITATIEDYGNGWYRCSASDSETSTFNQLGLYVSDSATGADVVPSGSGGTDGILIWGYQTEEGLFPTSYMPTSGSTCTRNADTAEITGTSFSSWYSQGPNSVVTEFTSAFESPLTAVCAFTDGTTSNRISYRPRGYYLMTSGGGGNDFQFGLTAAQLPANTLLKVGYSLDTTGAFIVSGNASNSDVKTLPMPIGLNQMVIGKVEDLNMYLNGTISRISYYPTRLTDSQLQELTS